MSKIISLTTHIAAPAERCFLLSLSIDLHTASLASSHEKAIDGVTSGLIGAGQTVTWEANYFGIKWKMKTAISKYQFPFYFVSEMVSGPFKKIHHQHIFKESGIHTVMTDVFELEAPLGILGKLAEWLFLRKTMENILKERNRVIKRVAQSDEWKKYLTESPLPMVKAG